VETGPIVQKVAYKPHYFVEFRVEIFAVIIDDFLVLVMDPSVLSLFVHYLGLVDGFSPDGIIGVCVKSLCAVCSSDHV
jgi:hypothetical protein